MCHLCRLSTPYQLGPVWVWPAERCVTSVFPHLLDQLGLVLVWSAEQCVTSVSPYLLNQLRIAPMPTNKGFVGLVVAYQLTIVR